MAFSDYLKPIGVGSMSPTSTSKVYTNPVSKSASPAVSGGGGGSSLGPTTTSKSTGGSTSKSSTKSTKSNKSNKSTKSTKTQSQIDADAEAKLKAEIDGLYKESAGFLNKQQANLEASKPQMLQIAASPYEQAIPQVQASAEAGRAEYGTGMEQASLQGRSLLSDAQRLANELYQRNIQAFGGAPLSSTAAAAGELLGRETAGQMGQIRQNTAQSVQNLQQGLINFNRDVETKVQQLNLQKNEALARAEVAFRDALSQIDAQRGQLAQNKAAMKLDALRAFRSEVSNINAQERAFQQNIELMREQNRLNTQSQLDSLLSSQGEIGSYITGQQQQLGASGQSNLQSMASNTQIGGGGAAGIPSNVYGYIGNLFGGRKEDRYGLA